MNLNYLRVLALIFAACLQFNSLEAGCPPIKVFVEFHRNQSGHMTSRVFVKDSENELEPRQTPPRYVDIQQYTVNETKTGIAAAHVVISLKAPTQFPETSAATETTTTTIRTTTASLTTTVTPVPPTRAAPEDAVPPPSIGRYKYYSQGFPWSSAQEMCERDNGHLVIIDSAQELDFIKGVVNNSWVWIGVHELGVHNEYYTVKGEPWTIPSFLEWYPNKPNFYGGQDCVSLKQNMIRDVPCEEYNRTVICEYP